MLILSLWMSQEGWLQDCELSNLLLDCTQQDVSRSLCWAVSCQRVHTFVDSLISISIDWFQSPMLLVELRRRGFFFSSFLYQCLLAHHPFSIHSVLSPQQNDTSPANKLLNVAFLLFGKNALTVTAGNCLSVLCPSVVKCLLFVMCESLMSLLFSLWKHV